MIRDALRFVWAAFLLVAIWVALIVLVVMSYRLAMGLL